MSRWSLKNSKKSIEWNLLKNELHSEDIEMSGFYVADTVKYGVSEEGFFLIHHPVFPTLRTRPNDTYASYQLDIPAESVPSIVKDGTVMAEALTKVIIDGTLKLFTSAEDIQITHHCFPSTKLRASYELVTITNVSNKTMQISFTTPQTVEVDQTLGCMGICIAEVFHNAIATTLNPGASYTYSLTFAGRLANEEPALEDVKCELDARYANIYRLTAPMKLDTGNDILDTMFTFAKLRAGESVFDTMNGLMHSPGGLHYYAATWCNDQVEYAGPYFAYTGDAALIEASYNAYKMYTPFMSSSYAPIPSSIIAEGVDYWNGARDRGDAAMFLYGASQFALTCGNSKMAEDLLPGIRWCAEYCELKKNEFGVIESDSDELEGRFPSGKANLCTNTLAYSGHVSASSLEEEIGSPENAKLYRARAEELRQSIDAYFAREIHGMDTYAYYENCEVLRSWICMPLCVGIYDRGRGTVDALCSDYLMKPEGLLTAEGCPTIWDRSTLYGLRGIFASGYTEKATEILLQYCNCRLLGDRVPYAVEAYPEGARRHLSGESALFCKIITEGMLAMKPTGLSSFILKPTLPDALDHLYLTEIKAFGGIFDIFLERDAFKVIRSNGDLLAKGAYGDTVTVTI